MSGRRVKINTKNILAILPWWGFVVFGVGAFASLRWVLPQAFSADPFLVVAAVLARLFAWPTLLLFGLMAMFKFASQRQRRLSAPEFGRVEPSHTEVANLSEFSPAANDASQLGTASAEWTVEILRGLDWKQFELLCAAYYRAVGFIFESSRLRIDGEVDVKLYRMDIEKPLAILWCKPRNSDAIEIAEVRELLAAMNHENVARGIFVTTTCFTDDAQRLGDASPIQMLDGSGFLEKIRSLPALQQQELMKFAFGGDFRTPTCPSCGYVMNQRISRHGPLWECLRNSACSRALSMAAA